MSVFFQKMQYAFLCKSSERWLRTKSKEYKLRNGLREKDSVFVISEVFREVRLLLLACSKLLDTQKKSTL